MRFDVSRAASSGLSRAISGAVQPLGEDSALSPDRHTTARLGGTDAAFGAAQIGAGV